MTKADMIDCDQCGNLVLGEEEKANYNGFRKLCRCKPPMLSRGYFIDSTCPCCQMTVPQSKMACPKCGTLKIE